MPDRSADTVVVAIARFVMASIEGLRNSGGGGGVAAIYGGLGLGHGDARMAEIA